MKKNLWVSLTGTALLLTATGCLKEEAAPQDVVVDHRAALIQALDNQASTLVNGINKVIIEGKFLQGMALENPPQPIPLSDDNEINKAINYLLANQTAQGNGFSYKPDSKICSEVMAKNNPATCIEVMKQVTLTQTPSNSTDGTLQIAFGKAQPFYLNYSEGEVSVRTTLAEIIKTIGEVDTVLKQNGKAGFNGTLPTTYAGAFQLGATSALGVSSLRFSILASVDVQGLNDMGEAYSLQLAGTPNLLSLTLNPFTGIAAVSVSLPPVAASFYARNEDEIPHQVQVSFPGLSGTVSLNNALEQIALQAVKFTSPDAFVTVDGQAAAHLFSASQIDAHLQSHAGGDKSVSFSSELSAQINIFANGLINQTGQLNASIAQGTELYFKQGSEQAKVITGSVQLLGGGDFSGMMAAQQDDCIEGQQNNAIPLQVVVCQ